MSIILLASFAFFGAHYIPSVQANPGGSNLWDSYGKTHDVSGITVYNPSWAYDETKTPDSAANFQYSEATGYFSITEFENATTYVNPPLPEILQADFKMTYNATANAGELDDKYRIVYYVGESAPQVLVDWRTDNYTYLSVDGFDDSKPYWGRVGASPYLDAVDGSYMSESASGGIIGDFSFQNTSYGRFKNIFIQFYATQTAGMNDAIRIWLYREDQERYASAEFDMVVPSNTTWSWVQPKYNFDGLLNTLSKINNAKLYLEKTGTGGEIKIDAMRIFGQNSTIIRPDDNGTYTDWIGYARDWDEASADGNMTYVYAALPNLDESSSLANVTDPSLTWSIGKVRLTVVARQTMGDEQLQLMLVNATDGSKAYGSTYTPTRTFTAYTHEWANNPFTGSPWTWDDINATEAGVRSLQYGATWSGELRVTQMYLEALSPETNLWVDDLADDKKWTRVGASPYLNAVDSNYIHQTTGDALIGDFTFANLTGPAGQKQGSVFIEVRATQTADEELKRDDWIEIRLYNATSGEYMPVTASGFHPGGSYAWMSTADLSMRLNDTSIINGAKVYLVKKSVGMESEISVDAVRLKVWNEGSAAETVTVTWGNQTEPNNGAWTWDEIKNVRFVVETSVTDASDAGCMFWLTEAWMTLTLPEAQLKVGPETITATSLPTSMTLRPSGDGTFSEMYDSDGNISSTIIPDGDGLYDAWIGTYTAWKDLVIPPAFWHDGDSTYVSATADDLNETSHLTTTSQPWSIAKIKVSIVARQTTGNEQVRIMIANATHGFYGPAFTPRVGPDAESYSWYSAEWTTDPSDGSPWTWADMADLQAGVRSEQVGSWDGEIRVTNLYVDIMPSHHYTYWDEATSNDDTDYLYATSAVSNGYAKESSQLEDVTPPAWEPAGVRLVVYAKTDVSSDDKFYLTVVSGGAEYGPPGAPVEWLGFTPTTTYAKYQYDLVFNPLTNAPWTWAEINALEAGVRTERVGGAFEGQMRFTQLYVEVLGPGYDADVYVEDVWDLYGFVFKLRYDTTVLKALGYVLYPPVDSGFALVNDTGGYVQLSMNIPGAPGHAEGVSGKRTLAKVMFTADSIGASALDIYPPLQLSTTLGGIIARQVTDGAWNDAAVINVVPSATTLSPGTTYDIDVTVRNEGNFTETHTALEPFTVTAKYENYTIGTQTVSNLAPGAETTVNIPWNPLFVPFGQYNISATATLVDESEPADNTYAYGLVTVFEHDVTLTAVTPSATIAYNGTAYERDINVTVKNEGNFTETFNVTAYYNTEPYHFEIGTQPVTLAAGDSTTLTFTWNSTIFRYSKEYGNYTIWAEITTSQYGKKVQYEVDVADNSKTADQPVLITIAGDVNGDYDVDADDLYIFAGAFGSGVGDPSYMPEADLDGDGDVDAYSLFFLARNYGKGI